MRNFKNEANATAHLLCVVVPADLEALFEGIGKSVLAGTFLLPPTMGPGEQQHLQGIAEKYGQELFPPDYFDK